MSSFVISKQEYIKAAGLIAGMMQEFKEIWLYDEEIGGRADQNSLKRMFVKCYEMNAESVADQYGDPIEMYNDENEYDDLFHEYMVWGVTIAIGREGFREAIAELISFFRSSIYQTERDDYAEQMQALYDRIITLLTGELLRSIKTDSWGEFNIRKPKNHYERII